MAIAFAQIAQKDPGNSTLAITQTVIMSSAQTAGNCNVVGVIWADGTTTVSISDVAGNTYISGGRFRLSIGGEHYTLQIFFALSINAALAGVNVVTATWSGTGSTFQVLQVAEYSGVDTITGLYNGNATDGTSAGPAVLNLTGSAAADVAVVFGPYPDNANTTGPATGCTQRGIITSADSCGWVDFLNPSGTDVGFNLPAGSQNWYVCGGVLKASSTPGAIVGTATCSFSATATAAPQGIAKAAFAATGTGTLTAFLTATPTCSFNAQGTLGLVCQLPAAFNATAGFLNAVVGTSTCAFAATCTAGGSGALGATGACSFAASGVLIENVSGTGSTVFNAVCTLGMVGVAPCAFGGSAGFANSISGTASCTLTATGGLIDDVSAIAASTYSATGGLQDVLGAIGLASFGLLGAAQEQAIAACKFTAFTSGTLGSVASCGFIGIGFLAQSLPLPACGALQVQPSAIGTLTVVECCCPMVIGDVGNLQVTVDDTGGTLQDPSSVSFKVLQPDGTVVPLAANRVSAGLYTASFPFTQDGTHWVKAIGGGPAYPFVSQLPIAIGPSVTAPGF